MLAAELSYCTWLDVSDDGIVRVEATKIDQRMTIAMRRACLCGERVRILADGSAFFGHLEEVSDEALSQGNRFRLTLHVAAGADYRDP